MTADARRNIPDPGLEDALDAARQTFAEARPKSLAAHRDACDVMPGGNTRTVLYHHPFPIRIRDGAGAVITDIDGNTTVNMVGEYTAGLFGHDHPQIMAAVHEALAHGINLGAHNTYEPVFARLVCARFPAIEKVRFTNSGTEANLMAVTAARAFTGKSKLMAFDGGYHGGVLTMKKGGEKTRAPFPWVLSAYNDTEAAVSLIREHADDLAAVILEPMMGAGGAIPAEPAFLRALREETVAAGSLLIFDEVMTSRLGPHGLGALMGVAPDITTLGKWVGGGMSFGGFGARAEIMDMFDPRREGALAHAGTFQNNVLTMAAGTVAVRDIYTPAAAEALTARGDRLRDDLNAAIRAARVPVVATGLGSLLNIHPTARAPRNAADAARADVRLSELLFMALMNEGYYIAPRGFIALSLALGDDELDGFVAAFDRVIRRHAGLFGQYGVAA